MHTYVLEREQFLPIGIKEAWEFFSTPRNLSKITPPDMGFEILPPFDDEPMFSGQLIDYRVRPLLGIPVRWTTRIGEVGTLEYFTDTQLRGPYQKWEHLHTFEEKDGGVLMKDRVEYALPFGIIGRIAHSLFVRSRLEKIFDYRVSVLDKIFPGRK